MSRHTSASLAKASAKLQAACDKFNQAYPVGTNVNVLLDGGEVRHTVTTSEAQVLSGHSAVIWLKGVSGCYLLDRVTPTPHLIQPLPVQRDDTGWWWHPGLPDFDEDHQAYKAWMIAQGLETCFHSLENEDDNHPAYIAYFEQDACHVRDWNDEAPTGEGWFTLSIHDSEDGPQWVWVRRVGTDALMERLHTEALDYHERFYAKTLPSGQRYSGSTFKPNGDPILLRADGKRSTFCDLNDDAVTA